MYKLVSSLRIVRLRRFCIFKAVPSLCIAGARPFAHVKHPCAVTLRKPIIGMPKRKNLSTATEGPAVTKVPIPLPKLDLGDPAPPSKRRASARKVSQPSLSSTNPNENVNVLDAPGALRASPDADEDDERINLEEAGMDVEQQIKRETESPLSELSEIEEAPKIKEGEMKSKPTPKTKKDAKIEKPKKEAINVKEPQFLDPEAEGDEEADEEEIQAALSRPPPVHSGYLPLPWKGRLGYVSMLTPLSDFILNVTRHVSVPICAFPIPQSSARGHAELHRL